MAMGDNKGRPSQSHYSSSIFPSKTKKNNNHKKNNNNNLISKKKNKKDDNLRAKAILHHQQLQLVHDQDRHPILRPKVYITDISNFKKLVQDLTGNADPMVPLQDYSSSSPPLDTTVTSMVSQQEPSSSPEIFEHSTDLQFGFWDQQNEEVEVISYLSESDSGETLHTLAGVESSGTESSNYGYYDQVVSYNSEGGSNLPALDEMLACQADLEALLQDMDQEFPLNNYSLEPHHHQILQHHHHHQPQEADLSIYDYDFNGIVC